MHAPPQVHGTMGPALKKMGNWKIRQNDYLTPQSHCFKTQLYQTTNYMGEFGEYLLVALQFRIFLFVKKYFLHFDTLIYIAGPTHSDCSFT